MSGDLFDDPEFLTLAEEASREAFLATEDEAAAAEDDARAIAEYREAHPGGTCASCIHAEPAGGARLTCDAISSGFPGFPRIDADLESATAFIVVPPDFGCNRHVERCHECGGIGGDCDAGDDGRSISWVCGTCGGSGKAAFSNWRTVEARP